MKDLFECEIYFKSDENDQVQLRANGGKPGIMLAIAAIVENLKKSGMTNKKIEYSVELGLKSDEQKRGIMTKSIDEIFKKIKKKGMSEKWKF